MHVPRSNEAEDNIHLSLPRAQRRCVASLGALSAQYSNLAAANSKPKAAQCGASDASLQDGSGSQCTLLRTLLRTRACARAFLARYNHGTTRYYTVHPWYTKPSVTTTRPIFCRQRMQVAHAIEYRAGWDIAQRGTRGCGAFREKTWQAHFPTHKHMRLG